MKLYPRTLSFCGTAILCLFLLAGCVTGDKSDLEPNSDEDKKTKKNSSVPGHNNLDNPDGEKVMAYVNGQPITAEAYKSYIYHWIDKRVWLDRMITDRLIYQRCQKLGIQITQDDVDQWVQKKVAENISSAGGTDEFSATLKKQGLNYDKFVKNIRKNAAVIVRLEKIVRHKRITPEAVKTLYNQRFGKKITFKQVFYPYEKAYAEASQKMALERAKSLLEKLKTKKLSFPQGVKFYSEAKSAKESAGNLGGYIPLAKLSDRAVRIAAAKMNPGQTSGLVKTKFGYHILFLKDRKGEYYNLYHIFISHHPQFRLNTDKKKKKVQEDLARHFEKLHEKITQDQLPFGEALLKNPLPHETMKSLRLQECPYGKKFESTVWNLKKGEISAPISSPKGMHIVRVERFTAPLRPFNANTKIHIRKILEDEEVKKKEILQLIQKLKREAKIRTLVK